MQGPATVAPQDWHSSLVGKEPLLTEVEWRGCGMTPPSAGHASLRMGRPPDKLVMMETYPLVELYLFRNPNFFQVLAVSLFLKAWKQVMAEPNAVVTACPSSSGQYL